MNEELEALLSEAREQGATQADLEEITRRYNAEIETVDVTETPSVNGELENILIEARGLGATDDDLFEISQRYADEKPMVEVPQEAINYDASKLDLVKEIQQAEEIPAGTYKDVEELNKTLTQDRLEEFKDTAVIEDKTEAQKTLDAFSEFFGVDDLIYAARTGIEQGAVVDDALGVMMQGKNISKKDLDDYIEAVKNMESYEPSDAMVQFQQASKEAGGGLLGFIKGVANNPIVIPEIFTQSVFSLVNKGSAAAAAPGALVGGAAGSAIPGAGTIAGAVSGGIAAASGALETALTFTDLLKDEVKKKGLEFDDDGIRQVLEDGNAMRNIRNKSMGRGAVIGAVDGISGGLAGRLGTSVGRKTGSKLLTGITGGTVEAVGGSLGEIAGTAVAGGEQNLQDILFEGVAGTATAPITVGRALLQNTEYKVNGQNVSRKFLKDFIESADPVDVAGATITIKDDPSLKKLAEEKRNDAQLGAQLQEELEVEASNTDLAELVDLEKKRQRLTKSTTKTGQRRLSDIESQIENKTQEIRDAVQKQKPDEVPVQPETRVSEEVEEKAPEARPEKIAPEIAEEVEINVEAIKTNVTPETERLVGLDIEAEDGATLNIDGTKYEQGGLVVPVVSENIKQSELTPERISEFLEKHKDKIGDRDTVKPGLYKFPNQDMVSLDLNIVIPKANREVGLQFGKAAGQESLFDLDTFENVKTGATGESPMSFTPEQFKEIAVALKENRMPDFLSEEKATVAKIATVQKAKTSPEAEPDLEKEVDAEELADLVRRQSERMTLKIEDGKPRLRLSKEGDEKVEPAIDEKLVDSINNLYEDGAPEIEFIANELSEDIEVNPVLDSKTLDDDSKKYGEKSVRRIEEFLGIPTLVTAYDILGTGTAKDSQGNDMRISGGVNFALGKTNRGFASANTTEEFAKKEFKAAKDLYRNNKGLFDRLWKEGKLPKGHIPVAILRMADTGMNSNEAVFRFLIPTIKKLPLENRQNAYNLFKENVLTKKNEKGELKYSEEVRNFLSKNTDITTLDQLFEKIVEDAGKRKEARTSKEAKELSELAIDKRKEIAEDLIAKTLLSETGKKTALKEPIKELFKGQELGKDSDNFYFETIYNALGEESMLKTPPYSVVGLAGIDIFSEDSGPKKVDHENYGFGNKGQIIALFSNPKLGVDVFPEFFAKASRVAVASKKGKFPSIGTVIQQIQGAFPGDKIFKGAAISLGERTEAQEIAAFMRQAFPTLAVSNTQQEFDNLANQAKARLVKSSKNVTILGIANGNKIFLNPSKASLETPIHEFGHVWVDYLRSKPEGRELLQKGFDLIDNTVVFDNASKKYGEFDADGKLTNKELVLEEALVEAIATKGGAIANASKKSKFKTWLKAMVDYIKKTFKGQGTIEYIDVNGRRKKVSRINERLAEKLSLDDFLNMALADLFSGKELNSRFRPGGTELDMRFRIDEADGENNKNVLDIVYEARQDGFSDNVIKAYLKKQGYSIKEIDSAMSIPVDLFQTMPAAFGNVEGGVSVGIKIYNRVSKKLSNLKKRKKSMKVGELRSKAIEFLRNDPDFKKQSEDVQMLMVVDYDKSLNTRANKIVNNEIKEIKTKIRQRKIGAKNLAKVKTDLRIYIRKNLPKTNFNKKFVTDLLKKVTDATVDTMPFIVSEVDSMINEVKSKDFQKRIDKLLKTKSATVQSGRLKGKISTEAQDSINAINQNINVDKENISAIETRLQALRDELDTISSETAMSEEQLNRAQVLDISINYLNSFLMEDSDFSKVETLQDVEDSINALITEGISDFKAQMAVQSRYYKSIIGKFLGQVVGKEVDMDNPDELRELSNRSDKKITQRNQKNAKNMFRRLGEGIRSQFLRTEAMEGLIDSVTRAAGDMFGGVAQQLTTDKVDDSSNVYKARMIEVFEKTLKPNATRIFGKKYTEQMRKNAVPKKVNVYTNPKRVSEIDALLKKEKDPTKRNELLREKEDLSMVISQNQMYYLYNQYKDPANHPGFNTMYGEQHPEVMRQMTEALDQKVKQWADWQVEELYPSLYPYYNAVYKKIYRTDMPWNQYYAGMLYRDGDNPETVVSMLSDKGGFSTYIGGKSTKMRIKNKKGIKSMDGDSVLANYVKDMEHFAAYSENVRDISKILKNQYVRKSMEANDGKTVLKLLDTMLEDIASRGLRKKADSLMVNSLNDMFVISKLGLNPTVAIKQMTSALAFADYIGYRNWVSYGAKAFANPAKVWKEMTQLSPLLQDRYKYSDIKRVMESYNETRSNGVLGATNKDKVVNAMMYLIKVGDMMGVAGSMSNYLFYIEKFKKEFPNLSEQQIKMKAIGLVEKQIKRTQQSQDIQDKDSWQRGNEFARAFSIFLSSTKALFRKEIQSSRNLYRKAISLDPKAGRGTVKDNLRTFMTYHIALPVLVQYVALGFPGLLAEWEEEDLEELAWAALLGNINSVFAIGDALQTIRDLSTNKPWAGDAKSVSAITIPTQLLKSIAELNKSIDKGDPEKINKSFDKFMNNMPFIPYQNVKKMYDNFTTLNTGENRAMQKNLLRLMNYSEYVIEGQGKKKK